jgi:hypothetical protein
MSPAKRIAKDEGLANYRDYGDKIPRFIVKTVD